MHGPSLLRIVVELKPWPDRPQPLSAVAGWIGGVARRQNLDHRMTRQLSGHAPSHLHLPLLARAVDRPATGRSAPAAVVRL